MYIKLIDNNDDIIETLQFLLYLCRINLLRETIYITSSSDLQKYFLKAKKFIAEFELRLISKSQQWNSLIKEFQLYSAYLNKNLSRVNECIQFFKRNEVDGIIMPAYLATHCRFIPHFTYTRGN